jgi:hypothetical protein
MGEFHMNDITIIKVPQSTFVLGEPGSWRPIYGLPTKTGSRPIVGFIAGDAEAMLEAMLEYADAHMREDDRP